MAKHPEKAEKPLPQIEIEPDAWERFKSAVHKVAKSGPKHRSTKGKDASAKRR